MRPGPGSLSESAGGGKERSFVDRTGVRWRVSEAPGDALGPEAASTEPRERRTEPRSGQRDPSDKASLHTRPMVLPSLYFESKSERRQLSPVPAGWEALDDELLEDLMSGSVESSQSRD